jgi:DNA repair protein RAD50
VALALILVQASDLLDKARSDLKEIASLRKSAADISRWCRDIETLQNDIRKLEDDLASSGSTKTVDDIKAERDELFDQM